MEESKKKSKKSKKDYSKLTLEEGVKAVKYARESIESNLNFNTTPIELPKTFEEKRGVWVTITKNGEIKGSMGFSKPVKCLANAIYDSSRAAAFKDPRFVPVVESEIDKITIELTVLSPPEKLDVERVELPRHITTGRHGLIVEMVGESAFLLPQVTEQFDLNAEDFLSNLCLMAGLSPDPWKVDICDIYRLECQIFKEKEPRGEIEEVIL